MAPTGFPGAEARPEGAVGGTLPGARPGDRLMCAAEGIEYLRPLEAGRGLEEASAMIRRPVAKLGGDRAV